MVNGQEIRKKQKYLQNVWKISPNGRESNNERHKKEQNEQIRKIEGIKEEEIKLVTSKKSG